MIVAPELPIISFAELAAELRVLLRREVTGNAQVEVFMAGLPQASVTLLTSYAEMLRATARLADVYHLMRRLAPIEHEVRALAQRHHTQETDDAA